MLSWAPAWAAAVGLPGCVATQRDVLEIEQQTDEIKAQVLQLKKAVSSMQANQADLSVKMDQVHSDLTQFTETLKDSHTSMSRLSSKLDDLEAALGQKVSGLGETITKRQTQIETQLQQTAVAAAQAKSEAEKIGQAQKEAEKTASGPTPSQLFHSAQIQLSKKNYPLAVQGFETYLEKYPKGEVRDLATFYLGEAHYAQKSWEDAARQYALALDRFPKSQMTPAARLKYALCLIHMKISLPEATRYLESISEDFPKSPEAAAAQKVLQRLQAPPPAKPTRQ